MEVRQLTRNVLCVKRLGTLENVRGARQAFTSVALSVSIHSILTYAMHLLRPLWIRGLVRISNHCNLHRKSTCSQQCLSKFLRGTTASQCSHESARCVGLSPSTSATRAKKCTTAQRRVRRWPFLFTSGCITFECKIICKNKMRHLPHAKCSLTIW